MTKDSEFTRDGFVRLRGAQARNRFKQSFSVQLSDIIALAIQFDKDLETTFESCAMLPTFAGDYEFETFFANRRVYGICRFRMVAVGPRSYHVVSVWERTLRLASRDEIEAQMQALDRFEFAKSFFDLEFSFNE